MPSTSTISRSLMNCSAKNGQVTMGMPAATLSRVDPHPQCVMKPPTAGWSRMATCGAHPRTTRHLLCACATPSASVFSRSQSRTSPGNVSAPLMTQSVGQGHETRAMPSCISCAAGIRPALPKLTYTTDLASLASSHAMHRLASSEAARGSRIGWWGSETGPTASTFLPALAARSAAEPCSSSSKLFTTTPDTDMSNSRSSCIHPLPMEVEGTKCGGSCLPSTLNSNGGRTGMSTSSSADGNASCRRCLKRYSMHSRANAPKPWKT
ncbi:Os04g0523812 [Oryza sativa Japonica Group]|uniref:Os04g0523812 protein n=1 Tax=Oryza sativa subsp. japonica TaxID=39947 RepID=A0A0N7KJD9_ORYSJ|nr:Os04g0523812 [Oryza sativa Japonica Group]